MTTATQPTLLPPAQIQAQISALEAELKALRCLLRASKARLKAEEERERRLAIQRQGGSDSTA
jgi:hypothetical protein